MVLFLVLTIAFPRKAKEKMRQCLQKKVKRKDAKWPENRKEKRERRKKILIS
jgi:hypothetical protein